MSVEPPPPGWVTSDAAFHHRRSILDGEVARGTQSTPRVVLEDAPDDARQIEWNQRVILDQIPLIEPGGGDDVSPSRALVETLRRWSDDVAFSTIRRSQLVASLVFIVVLALAAYGWQRETVSSRAADGPIVAAGGAPAAPRLSSDQVAWNDVGDAADGDGRRSTASFASDGASGDQADDDEPVSGAKLFVADGKKSSKGPASSAPDDGSADRVAGDTRARTGSGTTSPGTAPTGGKRTETTVSVTVRYESCAEAAAAGAAPIRLGEPGYRLSLDRDKDGIACENGSIPEDPGDAPVDSSYSNPTTTVPSQRSTTTTSAGAGAGTTSIAEAPTTSRTPTTSKPSTTDLTTTSTTSSTVTTESIRTTSTSTTTTTTLSTTSTTVDSTTTTTPSTTSTTATTTSPSTTSTSTTTTVATTTTTELPPIEPTQVEPNDSSNAGPT